VIEQPQPSTFVGRADELALIEQRLSAFVDRGPAVVFVSGEAGLGKSRLIGELRRRSESAGHLLATGRTSPDGVHLPNGTIVSLVADLARKVSPAAGADFVEPLQELLLGGDVLDSGKVGRIRVLEAARKAVEGIALERPLVIVLEDLHWADTGSIEMLDYIVRNVEGASVLIASTYRSDEIARRSGEHRVLLELRRVPGVTTIELSGLRHEDVAALVTDVAGAEQSWTVVDAVYRRSEGNPLFAEELTRVRDEGSLPPALRDLLTMRVEELPADARAVVAAAAILGSAHSDLLERVAGLDGPALDAAISDAIAARVLVADDTTTIRFRHALLHEAAQATLLPTERVRLHRRAAEAIAGDASLYPGGYAQTAVALGEHWFQCGDWPAACAASIDAAEAATKLYAMHATYEHLQRAIEAHRRAAGTCNHPDVDDVTLYIRAGVAANAVGELDAGYDAVTAAVAQLQPATPRDEAITALLALAHAAWNAAHADEAFAALERAETRLDGDWNSRAGAEVATMQARLLMISGRSRESIVRGEEALPLARAADDRISEAHILASLGPALSELGENDRAIAMMREAVAIAESVGDPQLLLRVHTNNSDVLMTSGRPEEAAAIALDGMAKGDPLSILRMGGAGANAIEALVIMGRYDDADRLNEAMRGKAMAGCTVGVATPALVAVRRGDYAQAKAEAEILEPNSPQNQAQRNIIFAEAALGLGQPAQAAAYAEQALVLVAGTDFVIDSLTAHAVGLQALADQLQAATARQKSDDLAKAVRSTHAALEEVESLVGDNSQASPWVAAAAAMCRAEATRILEPEPQAWRAAADVWQRFPAPFHIAYCRYREAEARLTSRGDRRAASEALTEGWQTARRIGARGLVAQCERLAERARIPLEDPHDASATPQQRAAADLALSPREVEVLDLLARGHTDAQIADELFVSKKTASVHVSNVVRKLDARDRRHAGELGREAGLGQ
jgi:DNA-binding CsgD family transcriptional regulator/tetratricopeptide (TPR) repeat protein